MKKYIIQSKSAKFNGLYLRKVTSHSIEWTDFELAAMVFDSPYEAGSYAKDAGLTIIYFEFVLVNHSPKPIPAQ